MQEFLGAIDLGANWLPALLALVGLPLLYTNLATQTHRDHADLLKDAVASGDLGECEIQALVTRVEKRSELFALDWWVVGALGVLLCAIMNLSNLQNFCLPAEATKAQVARLESLKTDPGQGAPAKLVQDGEERPWGLCSGGFKEDSLRLAMSLYAALFAILIGFRLIWARLVLARELKSYYACRFRVPCVDAG